MGSLKGEDTHGPRETQGYNRNEQPGALCLGPTVSPEVSGQELRRTQLETARTGSELRVGSGRH